ncbi:MAG: DUF4124 domain-containing protein [Candidatus Thiodiazotropha sp. (ex Notomyrtea botanica)]|nr:DUF4124 domain-containing protein [Candidatus Thiodiazotropha sp. (ex Notomyrtea botanica)]
MSLRHLLAAFMVIACLPMSGHAGKLYKWVDDEGHTHYSDKLPPSDTRRARSHLDDRGITVDNVEAAKTPEQIRQEAEEARLRREQERLAEKQRAEDRVLLRTFRTVDDIHMARDGQIQAVDTYIRVTESNIKRLKNTLEVMQQNAAELELSGQAVSVRYLNDIETKRQALKDSYQSIIDREREKNRIRQSFATDLKRFRELKKLAQTNDPTQEAKQSFIDALLNVYNCGESKNCDQAWLNAKAYLRKNSTMPVSMEGENILMTRAPAENDDISITISRIRDKKTSQTLIFMDLQCKGTNQGVALCARGEKVVRIKEGFQAALGGNPETPQTPTGLEIASPNG